MFVPNDVADLPRARKPADLVGRFENRDARAGLGETQRERQAEKAGTDDRDGGFLVMAIEAVRLVQAA